MPIETLWAVLGLAVPAALLLVYAALVQNRRISSLVGFGTLPIAVLMVAIVVSEVFGRG